MNPERQSGAEISEVEVCAFVGRGADYYAAAWPVGISRVGAKRFNLAGFFLTLYWLFYRKLFRIATLFLAVSIFPFLVVILSGNGSVRMLRVVGGGFAILSGIVVGAYGNGWYWHHARREIEKARLSEHSEAARLAILRKRGGTNLTLPFAFALALTVGLGVAFTALQSWGGSSSIDQSQSAIKSSETEFEYGNPAYGVRLRMPGAWHVAERNRSHYCDLESDSGMVASFMSLHYLLSLDDYYAAFKGRMLASGRYKAEEESEISVSGLRAKELKLRATHNGDLLSIITVRRRFTIYTLTVVFLQPESGQLPPNDARSREASLRGLPTAINLK